MKTIKTMLAIMIAFASFQSASAQSDKLQRTIGINTQTIQVNGVCDMDKRRIENTTLNVEGIKTAVWDVDTKLLTITYSIYKKEAIDNVQRKLASIGHDTEKYRATDAAYNDLPICCHYRKQ